MRLSLKAIADSFGRDDRHKSPLSTQIYTKAHNVCHGNRSFTVTNRSWVHSTTPRSTADLKSVSYNFSAWEDSPKKYCFSRKSKNPPDEKKCVFDEKSRKPKNSFRWTVSKVCRTFSDYPVNEAPKFWLLHRFEVYRQKKAKNKRAIKSRKFWKI
jgi:hypothetical protein